MVTAFSICLQVCLVFALLCGLAVFAATVKEDVPKGRIPIADHAKAHHADHAESVETASTGDAVGDPAKVAKGKGKGKEDGKLLKLKEKGKEEKTEKKKPGKAKVEAKPETGKDGQRPKTDAEKPGKEKVEMGKMKAEAPGKGRVPIKSKPAECKTAKCKMTRPKTSAMEKEEMLYKRAQRLRKIVKLVSRVIKYLKLKYNIDLDDIVSDDVDDGGPEGGDENNEADEQAE